jgi:hypothetical protein
MNSEPDDSVLENEQAMIYGLLNEAKKLADGKEYEPGRVPPTLLLKTSNEEGGIMEINLDLVREVCYNDLDKTRDVCRKVCVAIDAVAQMLVFETELKGERAPEPGSGLRPEAVFAVGRTRNSPRERAFVMIRGPEELHHAIAPNWQNFDERDNKHFAYVLRDEQPTADERASARAHLQGMGFELTRHRNEERERGKSERREQGRGFCQSM